MNRAIFILKKWFLDLKLGAKMILLCLGLYLITISLSGYFYIKVSSENVINKVSELSIQSLNTLSSNIDTEIKNVQNLSNIFLSSEAIQNALQSPYNQLTLSQINQVDSFIGRFRNSVPFVSSVYIYDNFGHRYYTDPFLARKLRYSSIFDAPWYKDVLGKKGGYILRLNADNAFISNRKSNFVSLIRNINDLDTIEPIGTLIINIEEKSFRECFKNLINSSDFDIALVDDKNQFIVPFNTPFAFNLLDDRDKIGQSVEKFNNRKYLVSYIKMDKTDWRLYSAIPVDSLVGKTDSGLTGIIIIVAINSTLLIIGLIFISQLATVPIDKLGKAMQQVKNRKFKKLQLNIGNNEIGDLQECYNIMISEIESLIDGIVEEQSKKRVIALNLLQAQFKPHFLYNSIDTVRSLLITEKKEDAEILLRAIGNYYRICLSKGKEVITIQEEVNILKSYLLIQQIYLKDIVSIKYNLDEGANCFTILKFVLQPLVENAIKHGIEMLGEPGLIKLSTKKEKEFVILTIEDNGVGIDNKVLEEIMNFRGEASDNSFGLSATIERLRLHYQNADVIKINSEVGVGTQIQITIPAQLPAEQKGRI